jgi:hypothetical protein
VNVFEEVIFQSLGPDEIEVLPREVQAPGTPVLS